MVAAADAGMPPMRPLFLEFPKDPEAWAIADQFLLGPDLLVAPIVEADARSRSVYLPIGAMWTDAWTGEQFSGGASYKVHAPLERIPLFLRDGARLPILDTSPTLGGTGVV
jgi:alpha-D-xyloside xylohydrolase